MMIVTRDFSITSCDDVELDIKRESKLEIKLSFDDEKEIEALLIIIQGLGDDIYSDYLRLIMENLATKHPIAIISPAYHCIGNRPQTGARLYLDELDKAILQSTCEGLGVKLKKSLLNSSDAMEPVNFLNDEITKLKNKKAIKADFYPHISLTLIPTKNDYQNFGVMPTIDVLNALLYVKKNPPFKVKGGGGGKNLPVIAAGGSYGGYLALMSAKFAPWLIDGVIDNSGGAKFLWRMIGFGKEVDYTKYVSSGIHIQNLKLGFFDKTFWTISQHSPYFFSPARRLIRYVLEPSHLEIQAAYPKPIYVSYHSAADKKLAPSDEKVELYEEFKKLGFDATLHLIKDESEIDGRFIKNLDHALGIPFKALINREMPPILNKIATHKKSPCKKSISYPCDDLLYTFSEKNHKMKLEISRI